MEQRGGIAETSTIYYHTQLGLPDKGRAVSNGLLSAMLYGYDLWDVSLVQRKVHESGALVWSGWLSSSSTATPHTDKTK